MIEKLHDVLKQAETWPEVAQDELLDAALEIEAALEGKYHATDQELVDIDRGLDDARQGLFATETEVRAAFAKFRRA